MPKQKPELRCPKCNSLFHYRKEPGLFLKLIEPVVPVKVFFCAKCLTNRYRVLSDKAYKRYEPVLW